MRCVHPIRACALAVVAGFAVGSSSAHQEILVGQSAAGQLRVEPPHVQPIRLPPSKIPGFDGYATGEVGFSSVITDEPDEDLYALTTGDIEFVLVDIDAGLQVLNDTGTAFMTIGEDFHLGTPFFDSHALWNVPVGAPAQRFGASVYVRDRLGIHADSEIVQMLLAPFVAGDMNCDTEVNVLDINAFVLALFDPAAYALAYPECDSQHADVNDDFEINVLDINPFVALLTAP
ncbi:hypothetical protein RAS1_35190 [Phycisphaerae bacterium RAS1]|nr:hypothetical protein RAS1_35190 [Phycisphaerae bacterium RAS1]